MQFECSIKSVKSCKELSTPEHFAALEDPLVITYENMINLLCYLYYIAKSSGAALVTDIKNPPFSTC